MRTLDYENSMRDKEIKFRKILKQLYLKGSIKKKQYKKELKFISTLKTK